MQGSFNFFKEYKYIIVPFMVWLGIQLFKFIYDLIKTKKFNFKRLMQAGGMPSSHSGVVISLTTMIGKNVGINSPLFAVALIFSFIVMYDAAGVRRAAGKQADGRKPGDGKRRGSQDHKRSHAALSPDFPKGKGRLP